MSGADGNKWSSHMSILSEYVNTTTTFVPDCEAIGWMRWNSLGIYTIYFIAGCCRFICSFKNLDLDLPWEYTCSFLRRRWFYHLLEESYWLFISNWQQVKSYGKNSVVRVMKVSWAIAIFEFTGISFFHNYLLKMWLNFKSCIWQMPHIYQRPFSLILVYPNPIFFTVFDN